MIILRLSGLERSSCCIRCCISMKLTLPMPTEAVPARPPIVPSPNGVAVMSDFYDDDDDDDEGKGANEIATQITCKPRAVRAYPLGAEVEFKRQS